MCKTKTVIAISRSAGTALLVLTLIGCSTTPKEDPAAVAARETRATEQRIVKAAAEARAAEEQRQAIKTHNTAMNQKVLSYEVGKTTWNDVDRDFGPTWQETKINPIAGKIGMLSTVRTATQRFDDPSKSTPLVGRIVIGSWKGAKRQGQVFVNYDRDPALFDVLVTLDFVDNVLVEKY
jgi:hypothetical protein